MESVGAMAVLREVTGHNPGQIRELRNGVTIVGRNPKRCHIVLDHFAVSREHARLELINNELYIEDLQSRNGVIINGTLIPPGPVGRRRLKPDDHVEIAGFRFIVEDKPSGGSGVFLTVDEADIGLDILSTVNVAADSSVLRSHENAADKLRAVLRIIDDSASQLSLSEFLPKVLDSLFKTLPNAERGFVLVRDDSSGKLVPLVGKRCDGRNEPIHSSRTIVDEAAARRSAILSGDASLDSRFASSESIHRLKLRSVMCAPLVDSRGGVLGAIQLEASDPAHAFRREDLHVFAGVARLIALIVENTRLHTTALEQQRNQLERRFRHLIEGSIEGILLHRDGFAVFVNAAWAELHGYSVAEVLDTDSILTFIAEPYRHRISEEYQLLQRGELASRRYEYEGLRKDGSSLWLENLVTVVEWEGVPTILSTVFDITDRKRAEAELRSAHADLERRVKERTADLAAANQRLEGQIAERRKVEAELAQERDVLRTLMDHLPDFVFIKDRQGRIITTNAAHMKVLKAGSLDEVRGKTDFDFFSTDVAQSYFEKEQTVMESGTPLLNFEELVLDDQGRESWMLTTKAPWRDASGQVLGIVGISRDITDRKQAAEVREHYMAELERSHRELDQFAAIASHDLQEPLRAISGFCFLLEQHLGDKLDQEGREMMDFVLGGAKRMQALIDALRTYARLTRGSQPREKVSLEQIWQQVQANVDAVIEESGAQVTHDPLPEVTADPVQIMQVLQNLVCNAIKFRGSQPVTVHLGVVEHPEEWEFFVKDNGIGIESQHFQRIFAIFQRLSNAADRPGTGIGLAVCKKVIEQHGGRIWVVSHVGQGSEFHFTLPKIPASLF